MPESAGASEALPSSGCSSSLKSARWSSPVTVTNRQSRNEGPSSWVSHYERGLVCSLPRGAEAATPQLGATHMSQGCGVKAACA